MIITKKWNEKMQGKIQTQKNNVELKAFFWLSTAGTGRKICQSQDRKFLQIEHEDFCFLAPIMTDKGRKLRERGENKGKRGRKEQTWVKEECVYRI